jgi:hypothetical protein
VTDPPVAEPRPKPAKARTASTDAWGAEALPAKDVATITVISTAVFSRQKDMAATGFLLSFRKRTQRGTKAEVVRAATKTFDSVMKVRYPGEAHHAAITKAIQVLQERRPDLRDRQVHVHCNFWEVDAVLSQRSDRGASTYLAEARKQLREAASKLQVKPFVENWYPKRIDANREGYERLFRGLHSRLLDLLKAKDLGHAEPRLWVNLYQVAAARQAHTKPARPAKGKRKAVPERAPSPLEALVYVLHGQQHRSFAEIAEALGEPLRNVQQAYHRFPVPRTGSRHRSGARHSAILRRSDAYELLPAKAPGSAEPALTPPPT